jgi:hypothetical protein
MKEKKSAILSFSRKKWLGDIALPIDNGHNSTWRTKAIENFLSSIVYLIIVTSRFKSAIVSTPAYVTRLEECQAWGDNNI